MDRPYSNETLIERITRRTRSQKPPSTPAGGSPIPTAAFRTSVCMPAAR
jgi:hypothetical protein